MSQSASSTAFSQLPISKAQLQNLASLHYDAMTPVQAAALPIVLQGKDLIAQAQTGSGKTAAFGIGLLAKINVEQLETQALVICPTRELADQVSQELRRLGRYLPNLKISAICGGTPIRQQIHSMGQHAPHIVVGTPGRLLDHLERRTLDLSAVKVLVLDEADRMLDMGFMEDMQEIIRYTPAQRQTLLFSATFPDDIERMSQRIQHHPKRVTIAVTTEEKPDIEEKVIELTDGRDKMNITARLLSQYQPQSTVVFCNTIATTIELVEYLIEQNISAIALHGDLDQRERDRVLLQFTNQSRRVLVATDVAARGLDIDDLAMVINYDIPFDPEVYIHRIGRTGRAGKSGLAFMLSLAGKGFRVTEIEKYLERSIPVMSSDDLSSTIEPLVAPMVTIEINEGKKAKVSAGDIVGALTANQRIAGTDIGQITRFTFQSYVAIAKELVSVAIKQIEARPIKGLRCKARIVK